MFVIDSNEIASIGHFSPLGLTRRALFGLPDHHATKLYEATPAPGTVDRSSKETSGNPRIAVCIDRR